MVKIKDIARLANVAPSTVSNVLNNTRYVSSDIRDKVMRAVEELNYTPNLVARSMRTKVTSTISVIIPEFNSFFTDIVSAIEAYLYDRGFSIIVCCTSENKEKEAAYLRTMLQRNIDGLIFLGTGQNEESIFDDYPVPIVMVDRQVTSRWPSVTIDNELGGYLATTHLLRKGYRRIALVVGSMQMRTYRNREGGYRKALAEYGIPYAQELVYSCRTIDYQSGWEAMRSIRARGTQFDAVFATNDFFAVGVLKFLLEHDIKVPGEVGVIGFDNISISQLVTPALTTISQPKQDMGEKAAHILLNLIEEGTLPNPPTALPTLLQPELIARDST